MATGKSYEAWSLRFYFFKIDFEIQIKFGFPTILTSVSEVPLLFLSTVNNQRRQAPQQRPATMCKIRGLLFFLNFYRVRKSMANIKIKHFCLSPFISTMHYLHKTTNSASKLHREQYPQCLDDTTWMNEVTYDQNCVRRLH